MKRLLRLANSIDSHHPELADRLERLAAKYDWPIQHELDLEFPSEHRTTDFWSETEGLDPSRAPGALEQPEYGWLRREQLEEGMFAPLPDYSDQSFGGDEWWVALPGAYERLYQLIYTLNEIDDQERRISEGESLHDSAHNRQLRLRNLRPELEREAESLARHIAARSYQVARQWVDSHISHDHPLLGSHTESILEDDRTSPDEKFEDLKSSVSTTVALMVNRGTADLQRIAQLLGVSLDDQRRLRWEEDWRDELSEMVDEAVDADPDDDYFYDDLDGLASFVEGLISTREYAIARRRQCEAEHPQFEPIFELTQMFERARNWRDLIIPIDIARDMIHRNGNLMQDYGGMHPDLNYQPTFDAISSGQRQPVWDAAIRRAAAERMERLASLPGVKDAGWISPSGNYIRIGDQEHAEWINLNRRKHPELMEIAHELPPSRDEEGYEALPLRDALIDRGWTRHWGVTYHIGTDHWQRQLRDVGDHLDEMTKLFPTMLTENADAPITLEVSNTRGHMPQSDAIQFTVRELLEAGDIMSLLGRRVSMIVGRIGGELKVAHSGRRLVRVATSPPGVSPLGPFYDRENSGWISPSGEFHDIKNMEHEDWARANPGVFDDDLPETHLPFNHTMVGRGWTRRRDRNYQIGTTHYRRQLGHILSRLRWEMETIPGAFDYFRSFPVTIEVSNDRPTRGRPISDTVQFTVRDLIEGDTTEIEREVARAVARITTPRRDATALASLLRIAARVEPGHPELADRMERLASREAMSRRAMSQVVADRLYHATSISGLDGILSAGVINAEPFASLSERPIHHGDINASDVVLVLSTPGLVRHLLRVEYDPAWAAEHPEHADYIAGPGWREMYVYEGPEYDDDDEMDEAMEEDYAAALQAAFEAKSDEREWISRLENTPVPFSPQDLLEVIVNDPDDLPTVRRVLADHGLSHIRVTVRGDT